VALDILGYTRIADVAPGEAIFISNEGEIFRHQCAANPRLVPCIFEHVYFARPDSIIDDISVYKSRLRMGEHLAKKILSQYSQQDHDIDVVIPIPIPEERRRYHWPMSWGRSIAKVSSKTVTSAERLLCRVKSSAGIRFAKSSTRLISSSKTKMCCWLTIP
jgi:hypothetical protein